MSLGPVDKRFYKRRVHVVQPPGQRKWKLKKGHRIWQQKNVVNSDLGWGAVEAYFWGRRRGWSIICKTICLKNLVVKSRARIEWGQPGQGGFFPLGKTWSVQCVMAGEPACGTGNSTGGWERRIDGTRLGGDEDLGGGFIWERGRGRVSVSPEGRNWAWETGREKEGLVRRRRGKEGPDEGRSALGIWREPDQLGLRLPLLFMYLRSMNGGSSHPPSVICPRRGRGRRLKGKGVDTLS